MKEQERKKEYMTDDNGRRLERYEGDENWVLRGEDND